MKQYISCDATKIKLIAILTMLIDHFAASIIYCLIVNEGHSEYIDLYYACRYIGRLAFPIFCFFIVEGYFHTKNVKKYVLRLFLFAIISELPFDMALKREIFEFSHQNVFFTLCLGLLAIWAIDFAFLKFDLQDSRRLLFASTGFVVPMLTAYLLKTDYSVKGVLIIVLIYIFHGVPMLPQIIGPVILAIWEIAGGIGSSNSKYYEVAAILAVPILLLYNGKRGRGLNKYVFYLFYPVHLLIFGIICRVFLY